MRVLVTRPSEDARRTAAELAGRGHEPVIAPLSEIRWLDTDEPPLADVQAIIATSSNGVRAFARRCGRRDIRVAAVGENTAATARAAGFSAVFSADGDAAALVATIRASLNPAAGALLHVAGKNRGGELRRELAASGFECRVCELYETLACRALPADAIAALGRGAIDAVLVLSPESGRTLAEVLRVGGVTDCAGVMACCISEAAAAAVADVKFGAVRIAQSPTLAAVLALLDFGPARESATQG